MTVKIPDAKKGDAAIQLLEPTTAKVLATASVALQMAGGSVSKASIVLGHVATTPWIATEAAAALTGKALNEDSIDQAAKAAVTGAKPLRDNAYKVQLARVAVKRALMEAAGRA